MMKCFIDSGVVLGVEMKQLRTGVGVGGARMNWTKPTSASPGANKGDVTIFGDDIR